MKNFPTVFIQSSGPFLPSGSGLPDMPVLLLLLLGVAFKKYYLPTATVEKSKVKVLRSTRHILSLVLE